MPETVSTPKQIGVAILALSIAALVALALAVTALAAPGPEGEGTLTLTPVVLPTTTAGNQSEAVEVKIEYAGEGEAWIEKASLEGDEPRRVLLQRLQLRPGLRIAELFGLARPEAEQRRHQAGDPGPAAGRTPQRHLPGLRRGARAAALVLALFL
jgi:hypothetical protein